MKKEDKNKEEAKEERVAPEQSATTTIFNNVLAIDLEVHHIAVTTNTANARPNFYGQKIRKIREASTFT